MMSVIISRRGALASLLCAAALLAGCQSLPGKAAAGAPAGGAASNGATHPASFGNGAGAAAPAPLPSGLADGIALYNKGDYNGAIRRLGQADVATGPKATQLAAFKYSAFSYCLTSRATLCRQQFDKALKLDPAFDLDAGEHGHPLWEPVFVKAKKAAGK